MKMGSSNDNVLCYPKSKQDDLTSEQKKIIREMIKVLKGVA
jgi:hypothetical protein